MQIEDLLDECVRIKAVGGDVESLLAQYPAMRHEVEVLLKLADSAAQLPPPRLDSAARRRMEDRLRARMRNPLPDDPKAHTRFDSDEFVHILATRLGASREELRRYLGPYGAQQLAEFLGLPGYGGLFEALRVLVRCLRLIEAQGVPL